MERAHVTFFDRLESPSTTNRRSTGPSKEELNESDNEANDDEGSTKPLMKKSGKAADNEEDTFLERFQQQQRKREKLETKEKISHRVFCPFYPEVNLTFLFFFYWLNLLFRSNKSVGGCMLPIASITPWSVHPSTYAHWRIRKKWEALKILVSISSLFVHI